jgi:hypothetical protein
VATQMSYNRMGNGRLLSTFCLTTMSTSDNSPTSPRISQRLCVECSQARDCHVSCPEAGGNVAAASAERQSKDGRVSPSTTHPPACQSASTFEPVYFSSTNTSSPASSTATLACASITFNVPKCDKFMSPFREHDALVVALHIRLKQVWALPTVHRSQHSELHLRAHLPR